ncbi:SWIM zinc finger family protein [Streptomyces microflavus]|uniref:SWIM zinc finger family protein n=1 Tax=Streptomyces microflavus TaxID=1919 RepID=UPI003B21A80E
MGAAAGHRRRPGRAYRGPARPGHAHHAGRRRRPGRCPTAAPTRRTDPSCSCPDWGYPCKHAAAVFYQVARLLDEDPFVLLLLRGRGERELMDELQRRNAVRAAADDAAPQTPAPAGPLGVPARDVYAAARAGIAALPPPPEADHPGQVASFATTGDPTPGLDPSALEFLAADTAARAARLLRQAALPCDVPHRPPARPASPRPRTSYASRRPHPHRKSSPGSAGTQAAPHTRSHERYGPGSRAAPQPCRSWTTRGTRTHRNSTWPARRSSRRGRADGPQDCEPRETG